MDDPFTWDFIIVLFMYTNRCPYYFHVYTHFPSSTYVVIPLRVVGMSEQMETRALIKNKFIFNFLISRQTIGAPYIDVR